MKDLLAITRKVDIGHGISLHDTLKGAEMMRNAVQHVSDRVPLVSMINGAAKGPTSADLFTRAPQPPLVGGAGFAPAVAPGQILNSNTMVELPAFAPTKVAPVARKVVVSKSRQDQLLPGMKQAAEADAQASAIYLPEMGGQDAGEIYNDAVDMYNDAADVVDQIGDQTQPPSPPVVVPPPPTRQDLVVTEPSGVWHNHKGKIIAGGLITAALAAWWFHARNKKSTGKGE